VGFRPELAAHPSYFATDCRGLDHSRGTKVSAGLSTMLVVICWRRFVDQFRNTFLPELRISVPI
jgi:hypothetical protein